MFALAFSLPKSTVQRPLLTRSTGLSALWSSGATSPTQGAHPVSVHSGVSGGHSLSSRQSLSRPLASITAKWGVYDELDGLRDRQTNAVSVARLRPLGAETPPVQSPLRLDAVNKPWMAHGEA